VGKQICQVKVIIVVVFRNTEKDIGQLFPGIYITCLKAAKQRIDDRCVFRRIMVAAKEIIVSSQNQGW
jgi:DNA gyrase inhibitor GyrI